jgi:hypothetical protein
MFGENLTCCFKSTVRNLLLIYARARLAAEPEVAVKHLELKRCLRFDLLLYLKNPRSNSQLHDALPFGDFSQYARNYMELEYRVGIV